MLGCVIDKDLLYTCTVTYASNDAGVSHRQGFALHFFESCTPTMIKKCGTFLGIVSTCVDILALGTQQLSQSSICSGVQEEEEARESAGGGFKGDAARPRV